MQKKRIFLVTLVTLILTCLLYYIFNLKNGVTDGQGTPPRIDTIAPPPPPKRLDRDIIDSILTYLSHFKNIKCCLETKLSQDRNENCCCSGVIEEYKKLRLQKPIANLKLIDSIKTLDPIFHGCRKRYGRELDLIDSIAQFINKPKDKKSKNNLKEENF